MRSVRRTVKLAGLVLAGLGVVAAATGWLYLLGTSAGRGPRVADALPLDELARASSVSLVAYAAVWFAAGLLLGSIARLARLERLTAAVLLAAATGGWLYAASAVSLFVVRQVPADSAFDGAQRVPAVYLGAALAGLGGALLGRRGVPGRVRAPMILAIVTATSGALDVAAAIVPGLQSELLVPRLAHALVVPAGCALILLARGLWRSKRRAWQLAVAIVGAAAVLHLLKARGQEQAVVSVLVWLALVARRHDFDQRGDPTTRLALLRRAALAIALVFGYGAGALWINRISADRPYTLGFALRETLEALAGLHVRGSSHLAGAFGEWFPLSVLALGVSAALALLVQWLAPWRYRRTHDQADRDAAKALVREHGADTLAPFTLRGDKSYHFDAARTTFLAYTVVAGVAVVSGDPVGPAVDALVRDFLAFAHARDWRVAILGASERYLDVYRDCGLQAVYHGEEAVVDTAAFSLDGRAIRKVRQSVHRLERCGFSCEVAYARELPPSRRDALERVAEAWRGDAPQRGFTMEFDGLFDVDGDDAVFVVGVAPDGRVAGFLHLATLHASRTLSLSSMPRLRDTPNGFTEWLVVSAIDWARANGYERLSLNFAPFAAVLAPDVELTGGKRTVRKLLLAIKRAQFQFDNLLNFNRKFFPEWTCRFVVYERIVDLPRVGVAGLAAEGYLPLQASRA